MTFDTYVVFDVESVGLHGEGFAVGASVINRATGVELTSFYAASHPMHAQGQPSDRDWLSEHLPVLEYTEPTPHAVRQAFWTFWISWHTDGATLAADVPWPVESAFLHRCILENAGWEWMAPYPLIDVASVRLAAGLDPLGTMPRLLEAEKPAHNPLADARQSARLLYEALETCQSWWHQQAAR